MQVAAGRSVVVRGSRATWSVGEGAVASWLWLARLAGAWWRMWQHAPRRLGGDPSLFVRTR